MAEQRDWAPYREPPEAGVGGEGPIVDQAVLAPTTDAEMEQAVHSALVLAPDVRANDFAVEVENGVVYLTGRSSSPEERRLAVDAARCVHGVERVVDRTGGGSTHGD
jgi:osmotically-inducible protein OsmY